MKKNYFGIILGSAFTAVLLLSLYMYNPVPFKAISTVTGFVEYTRSFGILMPIASFVITALVAIFPAIPFVILCIANGIIFGVAGGVSLTWAGALTGASILFYVSRGLGYDWAVKRYKNAFDQTIKKLDGYHGFLVILGFRLLPYFPAPLINIMAGISKIDFWWFFAASAIGKLPLIIGYTIVGSSLLQSNNYTLGVVLIIAFITIPYLIVRKTRKRSIHKGRD